MQNDQLYSLSHRHASRYAHTHTQRNTHILWPLQTQAHNLNVMHTHTHICMDTFELWRPHTFTLITHTTIHTSKHWHMQDQALTCVDFHVGAQVDGLGELAATHLTGVGHDCGVGQQVATQAAHLAKWAMALAADVGPLIAVSRHVLLETQCAAELLVAFWALKWLDTCW